jgi:polyisoprenoid-binding protein YceI
MVFAKVRGRFGSFTGTIDPDAKSVTASVDAASIDTGVAQRDAHLRSPDFLDADKFPQLSFKSKRLDGSRLVGDLTIRDVTREVVLELEDLGLAKDPWGNQRRAYSAKTQIDRTAFDLKWNQVLETGGVLVGEKLDVELEIQAVQAQSVKAA